MEVVDPVFRDESPLAGRNQRYLNTVEISAFRFVYPRPPVTKGSDRPRRVRPDHAAFAITTFVHIERSNQGVLTARGDLASSSSAAICGVTSLTKCSRFRQSSTTFAVPHRLVDDRSIGSRSSLDFVSQVLEQQVVERDPLHHRFFLNRFRTCIRRHDLARSDRQHQETAVSCACCSRSSSALRLNRFWCRRIDVPS